MITVDEMYEKIKATPFDYHPSSKYISSAELSATVKKLKPNLSNAKFIQNISVPPVVPQFGMPINLFERSYDIPDEIKVVIDEVKKLRIPSADFAISGGCVRDLILGSNFRDVDICINPKHRHFVTKPNSVKSYDSDLDKYNLIIGGTKVDFIANSINFASNFDYTINRLFILPDLTFQGEAQSWFDIDCKILRSYTIPTPETLIRGLRLKLQHNLTIEPKTYSRFQFLTNSSNFSLPEVFLLREYVKAERLGILDELFSEMSKLNISPSLGSYVADYELLKTKRDNDQFPKVKGYEE